MAKLEKRHIRIEDWKGNIYYPASASSTTSGVISNKASSDPNADPYTDGQYITDLSANGGESIMLTSTTEKKCLYKGSFYDLSFGEIIVGPRIKSNISTGTVGILEIKYYFRDLSQATPQDTLLDTNIITGDQFVISNEYITIPHLIQYKGTAKISSALSVEVNVLPDTNASVWFDQMYIGMEIGYSRTNVFVDNNRTLIIDTNNTK